MGTELKDTIAKAASTFTDGILSIVAEAFGSATGGEEKPHGADGYPVSGYLSERLETAESSSHSRPSPLESLAHPQPRVGSAR